MKKIFALTFAFLLAASLSAFEINFDLFKDCQIIFDEGLSYAQLTRIEKMENTLTEATLEEQYPEHYNEVTELINQYKDRYINDELGVPLSDLQNEKVNKALLPFKKQILDDKKSPDYIDEDITMMVDPNIVNETIDEALGLLDSVEAIYEEGAGVHIRSRFR